MKNPDMFIKPEKATGELNEKEAAFLDGFKNRLKSLPKGAKFAALALGESVKALLDKKAKNKRMYYAGLAMTAMSFNLLQSCGVEYKEDTKVVYPRIPGREPSERGHEKRETLQELYNDLVDIFPEIAKQIDNDFANSGSETGSPSPDTGSPSPESGSPNTGSSSPETGSQSPETGSPSPDTGSPSPESPDAAFSRNIYLRIIGWMPQESTKREAEASTIKQTIEAVLRTYHDKSDREKANEADTLTFQLAALLSMDDNIANPVETAQNIIKTVMVEVMYGDQIRGE